jgi:hypothetical protein
MSGDAYQAIRDAVIFLKEMGCHRKPDIGLWMRGDLALASDPTESAILLRTHLLRQATDKVRINGGLFTR